MGPILLMVAGIVLFVLLFGGGALWFIWPKDKSSQPFTIAEGKRLSALHIRQAAKDFDRLTTQLEAQSVAAAKEFLAGNNYSSVASRDGSVHQIQSLRSKMQEMVKQDFGEDLFAPRNLERDKEAPAVDESKVHPTFLNSYRLFYHAWKAGGADRFNDRYKEKVEELDKVHPAVSWEKVP